LVLNNYMHLCFRQTTNEDEEADTAALDSLARVIGIWGRVRVGD
jgi:hypothetical protein